MTHSLPKALTAVVACAIALLGPQAAAAADEEALARAGAAFLAALTRGQRDDATWAFDDGEREDVHYAPFPLDGADQRDLDDAANSRVDELLALALSRRGMDTVRSIRDLELAVREKERRRFWSFVTRSWRDSRRYFVAIFGKPSPSKRWAFRYEGHHVSLNVTSVPGAPRGSTPLFLGAEPRVVPEGWPSAGVAVLGREERLARDLYAALPAALRERATLAYDSGRGLMIGEVRRVDLQAPAGLPRSAMDEGARALLDALVERFVGVFDESTAAARRAEIEEAGRDALHFGFALAPAEAGEPRDAFYARVQGPRTLIEIDNTSDGDHVHAVWHDVRGDFGDDLLASHWRRDHGIVIGQR